MLPLKGILFFLGAAFCFLFSIVGVRLAWESFRQQAANTEMPQDYTVEALSQRGLSGNRHVRITNGELGDGRAVSMVTTHRPKSGQIDINIDGYCPILLKRDTEKLPLLLVAKKPLKGPLDRSSFGPLQGMVTSGTNLNPIPIDVQVELRKLYPNLTFSRCLLIELGETPATKAEPLLLMAIMPLVLLLVGLVCGYIGWRNWRTPPVVATAGTAEASPPAEMI
jgi:hypothetical protein